jgi:hypothetical protein
MEQLLKGSIMKFNVGSLMTLFTSVYNSWPAVPAVNPFFVETLDPRYKTARRLNFPEKCDRRSISH